MELIYKQEVFENIAAAIGVHRELGRSFHEPVYQEALELELQDRRIPFESQVPITIFYKGRPLRKEYIPDLIVFGEVIAELKALDQLTSKEDGQIIHYLRATRKKVGLLVNFGSEGRLEWKRFVN